MVLLVVPVGCQGCRDGTPGSPAGEAVREAEVSSQPVNVEMDMLESNFFEGMEWGPADTRMLQYAGTMDTKNRYTSTVMLTMDEPMNSVDCSGILLAPRLVLTAGSCVCTGQDSSTCQERMFVTAVFYESAIDEFSVDKSFQTVMGRVRPHPEFRRVLGGQGYAVAHRADLAVILLDEPMLGTFPKVHLARTGAQAGEFLIMVGYGHDEIIGTVFGTRYFRKNRVSAAEVLAGGSFSYEQQGPYLYEGYDGGPCLREDERGLWLVGIASAGSDRQLFCTSILDYREWLSAELQNSRRQSP
jgi:V8-like Glu-specific endopeptidase